MTKKINTILYNSEIQSKFVRCKIKDMHRRLPFFSISGHSGMLVNAHGNIDKFSRPAPLENKKIVDLKTALMEIYSFSKPSIRNAVHIPTQSFMIHWLPHTPYHLLHPSSQPMWNLWWPIGLYPEVRSGNAYELYESKALRATSWYELLAPLRNLWSDLLFRLIFDRKALLVA